MAFVQRTPSGRWLVKQGNTGEQLSSWGSREAAEDEVRRLHRKNDPQDKNRGAPALARERTREREGR